MWARALVCVCSYMYLYKGIFGIKKLKKQKPKELSRYTSINENKTKQNNPKQLQNSDNNQMENDKIDQRV